MKKIGIYGGTFDPIHHGHLILAREAAEVLGLEKLIFIPAAVSPHKLDRQSAAPEARLEMLRAAIAGDQYFEIDEIELQRPPPSYTFDTISSLHQRDPNAKLIYLIGDDLVCRLETWHRFPELSAMVEFVVLTRHAANPKHSYREVRRHIDISATDIRNRVATGRSIRYLVPAAVEKIIIDRQLYREPDKSPPKN